MRTDLNKVGQAVQGTEAFFYFGVQAGERGEGGCGDKLPTVHHCKATWV